MCPLLTSFLAMVVIRFDFADKALDPRAEPPKRIEGAGNAVSRLHPHLFHASTRYPSLIDH